MTPHARLKNLSSLSGVSQFIKFALIGCVNVGISTVVFYLCYEKWKLGSSLLLVMEQMGSNVIVELEKIGIQSINGAFATAVGYTAGMINSYLLNRSLTFGIRTNTLRQVRRFVVINIMGLSISTLIMFVFVDLFLWPYMVVWVTTIVLVMTLNFIGYKYWTFAHQEEQAP